MKEKLAKLLNVKSIITITLTFVVAYLTVAKEFDIRDIYMIIVAFYFGTQHQKTEERL